MSELRKYLQQKGEAWAMLGHDHAGKLALWYAENGEDYEWSPRPDDVDPGIAKECYKNALDLAMDRSADGWLYAEGYVMTASLGIEIHHAWVVKPDGTVVDPTLRDKHQDDDCPFCQGNGQTEVEVEWDEGEAVGWEERDCEFCGGTGEPRDEHPEREGTTYVGVTLDLGDVAKALIDQGSYGLVETVMDIYATKG